ncbi:hypothetical protein C2845_PM11G05270 [Panicum miliaceum]|uniref:CCHC-type domain-containing protein n=1 Tax=Panicum miliaceum TaxID=4540 RepID=A0A3L6RNV7_PANMI|nr:hypothetical protein C2845_PM11G05270 [Panicum miliaceum]
MSGDTTTSSGDRLRHLDMGMRRSKAPVARPFPSPRGVDSNLPPASAPVEGLRSRGVGEAVEGSPPPFEELLRRNEFGFRSKRGRSEILQRVERVNSSTPRRNSNWGVEESKAREALEIKRTLFSSAQRGFDAERRAGFSPCEEDRVGHAGRAVDQEPQHPSEAGDSALPELGRLGTRPGLTKLEEGWKARKVYTIQSPPPLLESFASVAKSHMSKDQFPHQRWGDQGDRMKRRFEAEKSGWEFRRDAEFRRDHPPRDKAWDRDQRQERCGDRDQRQERMDEGFKRRTMDESDGQGRRTMEDLRNRPPLSQGNKSSSVHERLGKPFSEGGRSRQDDFRELGHQSDFGRGNFHSKDLGTCFWCGKEGHHQATCKEVGHIAAACPKSIGCSLEMRGFAFPGQGFYSLSIPGSNEQQPVDHVGMLQIISGEASVERIEEELKLLIASKWNWKVRKISDAEYAAAFPSKDILNALALSKGIELSKFSIFAKTGWVKISNIPQFARTVEAVKLIAELAGEVVVVDELSLIREGPMRVKLNARNLSNLRGFIEIFIGRRGYELKFLAEDFKKKVAEPKVPPIRRSDDELSDEDEEEQYRERESTWNRHSKSKSSDGQGDLDASIETDYSGNQHTIGGLDQICLEGASSENLNQGCFDDPALHLILTGSQNLAGNLGVGGQEDSSRLNEAEFRGCDKLPPEKEVVPMDHFKVHTAEGVTYVRKDKWPTLVTERVSPVVSDMEMNYGMATKGSDSCGGDHLVEMPEEIVINESAKEWEVVHSAKPKKKRGGPVVAARKSSRGKGGAFCPITQPHGTPRYE